MREFSAGSTLCNTGLPQRYIGSWKTQNWAYFCVEKICASNVGPKFTFHALPYPNCWEGQRTIETTQLNLRVVKDAPVFLAAVPM